LANGRQLIYVDSDGRTIFFDPSVSEPGPQAALVDREAFLSALDREGLSAFWVIAGEKGVFGGRRTGDGFGGRLVHTYVYQLSAEAFICHRHVTEELPTAEQLEMLFGGKPPVGFRHVRPAGSLRTRARLPRRNNR
jgi:hypothetical protein